MATYTPVSRHAPHGQRVVEITSVAAGDQIDLVDALGRPATVVQFHMAATTDVVDYRLNSLIKRTVQSGSETEDWGVVFATEGTYGKSQVEIWSQASRYPVFSSTGSTVLETGTGLQIKSIEIDALTGPATITIIAW